MQDGWLETPYRKKRKGGRRKVVVEFRPMEEGHRWRVWNLYANDRAAQEAIVKYTRYFKWFEFRKGE